MSNIDTAVYDIPIKVNFKEVLFKLGITSLAMYIRADLWVKKILVA